MLPAVITAAAVGGAEIIATYGDPRYSVAGPAALLVIFLCCSALATHRRPRAFFLTMAIVPLIRVISLGVPLAGFPPPLRYLVASIPLFVAAFLIMRVLSLTRSSINLRWPSWRKLPIELGVLIGGIGLSYIQWLILRPGPLISGSSVAWIVGAGLILLVSTGFLEELLFRGLLQRAASNLFGPAGGIIFTAVVYGLLHIGYRSVIDVVFMAGVGLYFSLAVWATKSLLGVTMAHGAVNIMLFIVLPLTLSAAATHPIVRSDIPRGVPARGAPGAVGYAGTATLVITDSNGHSRQTVPQSGRGWHAAPSSRP